MAGTIVPALSWRRSGLRPLVIGHRGAPIQEPENTMRSFRRALELGADLIECDVHFSSDGRLVVIHDETVDRTTDGTGPVNHLTTETIQRLDAGQGEKIPLLSELLEWVSMQAALGAAIEIKPSGGDERIAHELARSTIAEIRQHSLEGRTIIISFDSLVLKQVREEDSEITTGYLFSDRIADILERTRSLGCQCVLPGLHRLDRVLVENAHRLGLGVVTWTANSPAQIRHALASGVDGIASDAPDRVLSLLSGEAPSIPLWRRMLSRGPLRRIW